MSLLLNLTVKSWISITIYGLGLPLALTLVLLLFVAPITEEAVKLLGLPLLWYSPIPHRTTTGAPVKVGWRQIRTGGVMSGLGFGVGEIWAIAVLTYLFTSLGGFPWIFYQGFIIERFLVVFIHGFMALTSYWGYWRWLPITYLVAVGIHATVNLPVLLYQLGLLSGMAVMFCIVLFSVTAFFAIAITFTQPEKRIARHLKDPRKID